MIGKKINQLATELAPASTDLTIIGNPTTGVSKKITLAQLGAIFSGAVSFYTNYASFPATGTTDVIFCAKDTQKLYLWSGSAYVEVFPSQALLDTYQLRSEKGNANGYASLDSQGKVPISQLPSSIMEYKGTWSAATNTPTLANGTGDTGDVYICNAAGSVNFGAGAITFAVGDYVIYSGTIWQRSSGAVGTVTSVAATITGDSVTISGSPVTTSGTLAFAFAGTGAQYIKGDGTLATFPTTIDQAKNLITEVYNSTGATLTKGTVVYINGGQGNLPTVTKALASGDSTSAQTYGIVQADITNNNNGFVVVAGRLSDIDTQAYSVGTQLYLSSTTAGAYTSTKQYAPAHLVYVGIIVRSHPTQGIIEVKIQNGYELDELHNVAAQTPTNNDGLFWESSTSLWKNKSLSTILGGTPVTGSGNVNTIPKFTANSVLGNSNIEDDGNFVSMRGLKINAVSGVGNTINFEQGTGVNAAGIGYSTIGAASTTGFLFYIDQNTTSRSFVLDTSTILSATQLTYSLPASNGTLALVSQLTGGTVTSVGLSVPTGFAVSGSPVTSSGTLALAFDTGYSLPTIVKQNNWDTAYNARIVTASSPLSFISNTISISQASGSTSGYLSSTDWTTFNNKQNALTNPVTGTGTTNYLPKFTGTSTIGNSSIYDNGGNIGIGIATSTTTLELFSNTEANLKFQSSGAGGDQAAIYVQKGTGNGVVFAEENRDFIWRTGAAALTGGGGSERMRLTNTGNLGLGVTPSAWGSAFKAIQVGGVGSIMSSDDTYFVSSNSYINSSSSRTYITNGYALEQRMSAADGQYQWKIAPSGTAGNAISFTQAMTLNASGNLSIGNTNDTYKLDVTGTGRFSSNLTFGGSGASWLYGYNSTQKFGYTGNGTNYLFSGGTAFRINNQADTSSLLILADSGAATFSSSVTAGGTINQTSSEARLILNRTGGTTFGAGVNYQTSGTNNWIVGTGQTTVGTDYQIYNYGLGSGAIAISYANNNVGIGTTSPSSNSKLAVSNGGANGFEFDVVGASTELRSYNRSTSAYTDLTTIASNIMFQAGGSERMRITSGGEVLINMTTTTTSGSGTMLSQGSAFANVRLFGTGSHTFSQFFLSGTAIGSITGSGSTTSYNTSSDYRLKQDLKDFNGLDLVSKLKAYDYEWKADKTRSYGVIAHELQSVINYAVTGVKDGKEMQGVDYSKIVPVLIKSIQELKQELDTLKNK